MIQLILISVITIIFIIYFYYWIRAFIISAPYYPSNKKVLSKSLEEFKKNNTKHVVELGAGDGKVAILLAKNGIVVTAVEINPILALLIWLRRVVLRLDNLHVYRGDFLKMDFKKFDGAFIYLYPKVMDKLSKKLYDEMPEGSLILSNTFNFHDRKPEKKFDNKLIVYKVAR